ncbi:hypothetical protein AAFN47_08330 [Hoeflea sp. CAU 1731]
MNRLVVSEIFARLNEKGEDTVRLELDGGLYNEQLERLAIKWLARAQAMRQKQQLQPVPLPRK